jgi:anthranilate synthase/indole-3-glycerol phosphate synthase/phosphoribosylanthranilate isomerase
MAVRHRTACVEAVQYHPESCMSEGGKGLVANFLKMKGGSWGGENAWCGVPAASASTSEASASAGANGVSLRD